MALRGVVLGEGATTVPVVVALALAASAVSILVLLRGHFPAEPIVMRLPVR
jgi:hypothetical protein